MTVGTAVQALEQLVADLVKDTRNALNAKGAVAVASCYTNLATDIIALLPQASSIGAEIKSIQLSDIGTLVSTLVNDLALTGNDVLIAENVSDVILKAIALEQSVMSLVASVKSAPAPVAS